MISPWFEERKEALKGIKCTATDMSAGYAKIARDYMPQAENCFDNFHVIAAAIKHGISNVLTEGLNSKIETIKRYACGFRNKAMF